VIGADRLGLRGDPRRHVREADVADLAGGDQIVERSQCLVDRGAAIPAMQPVEVDVVGLQPPQRLLKLGDERLAAGAAPVRVAGVEVGEELRAERDAFAPAGLGGEELADDLLGVAVGVDVGGVDDVAAAVEVLGEHRLGGLGARAPAVVLAEGHGAQRERADAQARAAERDVGVEEVMAPRHHGGLTGC
jgi:hypothetical protein